MVTYIHIYMYIYTCTCAHGLCTVLHVFHAVGILKVKGNNKYLCIFVELSYCMHFTLYCIVCIYMSEVHVVCA